MNRNKAEQLEEAIECLAQGESVPEGGGALLKTVRQAQKLAAPVPPPPHKLAPGRQRLLAEAARFGAERSRGRKEHRRMSGIMKLGTALVALILVSGFVLGAGQVMADSLPGEPLYAAKLAAEDLQARLTGDAEAKSALELRLAERRMDEVVAMLQQNKAVDEPTALRVEQQLEMALAVSQGPGESAAGTLQQLALAIQERQQAMEQLAGDPPEEPLQRLFQHMHQVRQATRAGTGEPAVEPGVGAGPGGQPDVEPGAGYGPGGQPDVEPGVGYGPGEQPDVEPGAGYGPGGQPDVEPGAGYGPGEQPDVEPGAGYGPGGQPDVEPGTGYGPGGQPDVDPGTGYGPGGQPDQDPGTGNGPGPQPVDAPDNGPGPGGQPDVEPGPSGGPGPQPVDAPDNGPGPGGQPDVDPGPSGGPGGQPETQPDTGTGQGTQPAGSSTGSTTTPSPVPSTGGAGKP